MKNIFIILASLLLFTTGMAGNTKKVVIIGSYHKGYAWSDTCVEGINSVLANKYIVKTHFMDTKRLPRESHPEAVEKAFTFIEQEKPDLILLGDDNSLKYLGPGLAKTKIPVVFYGINENPRIYFEGQVPSNITGILEIPLTSQSLRYINKLLPDSKKVIALFDNSTTTEGMISTIFQGRTSLSAMGITMDVIKAGTFKQWQQIIANSANLGYDAIILNTIYTIKDDRGNVVDPVELTRWTSKNTPLPLFGTSDTVLIEPLVAASYLIKGEKHGELAGSIALQILLGRRPSSIPFLRDEEGELFFITKQLERFHISVPLELEERGVVQ